MNVFSPQVHKSTGPQVHRSTGPQVHTSSYKWMSSVHKSSGPQVHRSTLLHINGCLRSTSPQVHRSTLLHINQCLHSRSPQVYRSTGPPFWFKNQVQLSTHLRRTCLQRIFQVFFPIASNGDYMLAKIVGSSFSAGEQSE